MLNLDIPRICAEKGIANPKKFLMGLGFFPNAAAAMIQHKRVRIDRDQVEKICIALRCTPNDLFSWQPGKDAQIDPGHPMRALIREQRASIPEMLQVMTPEQIEDFRRLMEERMAQGREA
jgi:DNA-binding Xre family transcriptional regulator